MGGEQGEVTYMGETERYGCEYGGVDCQHLRGWIADSDRARKVEWRRKGGTDP